MSLWEGMEMADGREQFIRQLEEAAENVRGLPPADIAVLLRRAALCLRNIPHVSEEGWTPIEDNDDDPGAA
jgi:hypothetical protein